MRYRDQADAKDVAKLVRIQTLNPANMTGYKEFQVELENLHQQAEQTRRSEQRAVLDRIKALMVEYELLPSDLGFATAPKRKTNPVAAKYRDPRTGATWSGRGRVPSWLDGKDREKFAV